MMKILNRFPHGPGGRRRETISCNVHKAFSITKAYSPGEMTLQEQNSETCFHLRKKLYHLGKNLTMGIWTATFMKPRALKHRSTKRLRLY